MGLRPRFKTPLSQARDKLLAYLYRPLLVFQPRTRFLIGCSVLVLLTTLLLLTNRAFSFNENYQVGEVLARSIVAPSDLSVEDQVETERLKNNARASTRAVFNYDSSRGETSVQSFRSAWNDIQQRTGSGQTKSETDLDRIASIIREVSGGYIYDDNEADRLQSEIVLVDVRASVPPVILAAPRTRMIPLSTARRSLETRILNLQGWSSEQKAALSAALAPLIRPNVALDQTATAAARETEASRVQPVVISLKRNQVVAREGDTVTPSILAQIAAIRRSGNSGRPWHNF